VQLVCVVSPQKPKPLADVRQHAPIVDGSGRLQGFDEQVTPVPWNTPLTAAQRVSDVKRHAWRPLGRVTQHAPPTASGAGKTSSRAAGPPVVSPALEMMPSSLKSSV
jgi:hypothetical protein